MSRVTWSLHYGRPTIEIVLVQTLDGSPVVRTLLSDTGAGAEFSAFELILDEHDCLLCGGTPIANVQLGGAYSGSFPIYGVRVQIPQISFDVVGVPQAPSGVEGIAGFRFLNRFVYGNFGNRGQFGIEL